MTTEPTPVHDEVTPTCACGHVAADHIIQDPGYCRWVACPCSGYTDSRTGTSGTEDGGVAADDSPAFAAPVPAGRLDLDPIRRWYGQAPAVTAEQRLTRGHVGRLLDEVDEVRAIELAALVLLRASGPDASWGEHEAAERVLHRLLKARGHQVGESAA